MPCHILPKESHSPFHEPLSPPGRFSGVSADPHDGEENKEDQHLTLRHPARALVRVSTPECTYVVDNTCYHTFSLLVMFLVDVGRQHLTNIENPTLPLFLSLSSLKIL